MADVVERALRWGLSHNDGYARTLADEVRRLREQQAILADPAASLAELVELRAMRERARDLLANPDEDEAWQHAARHILGDL